MAKWEKQCGLIPATDRPAAETMAPVAGRGYAQPYANDGRGVYAIACSFSSETATISDWLMRQVAGKA